MRDYKVIGSEIPNNEARTGEFDLGHHTLVAIEIPTGFAGTTITFQSKSNGRPQPGDNSNDDLETWRNVYDSTGNEVTATVAANRVIVDIPELSALRFLRIRSGTSSSPLNQSPSMPIKLIVKE